MLTKRMATIAIFSGVLAKMAHADDPNWKPFKPTDQMVSTTPNSIELTFQQRPAVWTVNLDQVTHLDVMFGGEKVTLSAAEIFAALQS